MRIAAAMCALALCCNRAPAARPGRSMHGYALSDFGDFARDWRLVTARYRQDISEQRFTYANAAAMKALAQGGAAYPDGAMFGKVGFIAEEDKVFPSSLVPSGARRYQFMVRDAKRFKDTDGWGYVIFNGFGASLPGDPGEMSQACATCHRLVADRGFVFSQPLRLAAADEEPARDPHPASAKIAVEFEDRDVAQLPARVSRLIPSGVRGVRALRGELQRHLFAGTLDEVRPLLAHEAIAAGRPALIAADDQLRFAMTWQDAADTERCPRKGLRMRYAISGPSPKVLTPTPEQSETILREGSFCFERP